MHNALGDQPLDFFVLASSLFTVVERPGQCNYNAGNAFLEAFCRFRRNKGLAASVIHISPIDQIGFVSQNPNVRRKLKASGLYFQREKHLLDFLELAILRSKPTPVAQVNEFNEFSNAHQKSWSSDGQFIMGLRSELPLDDPKNRIEWRRDRRMGLYHNVHQVANSATASSTSDALGEFLAQASEDPSILNGDNAINLLSETIGRKILDLTLQSQEEVTLGMTIGQLGLDSLTAMEVRRWWKQALSLEISVLEILGAGTLRELGVTAANHLQQKFDIPG